MVPDSANALLRPATEGSLLHLAPAPAAPPCWRSAARAISATSPKFPSELDRWSTVKGFVCDWAPKVHVMATAGDGDDGDERGGSVKEQDRFLPIANISRIMKKTLPSNAKIAKDAKETVQECVSEFISFITSE